MSKEKKKFKVPHLLWIMIGMLFICSLVTYIIPAGQFGLDENGKIIGNQFTYLGYQTPVNPIQAIMTILPGLVGSAPIIFVVMISGANTEVFLSTKSFDALLDFSIDKLSKKGTNILISILFCLMVYLGAFGGTDALIAIVPIGIVFAKKLKLDPITALGLSVFATQIGFGTGPTKCYVVQGLMGTKIYGAFLSRFIIMNIFMIVGLLMLLSYVNKIRKRPELSLMYSEGWRPVEEEVSIERNNKLGLSSIICLILFFGQYLVITIYGMIGDATKINDVMVSVMFTNAILMGIVNRMDADEIGNTFAKGCASLAFVCVVIGIARSISMILTNGNVLHTIVYNLTLPLINLHSSISTIGMMLIIALINPIIPSATSKAAILVPIIKPIGEVLNLSPEMIVQAFQFGDGFTNIVSPLLGWTVGSVAMANVPFSKYIKFTLPKVCIFIVLSAIMIFIMTMIGWNGSI